MQLKYNARSNVAVDTMAKEVNSSAYYNNAAKSTSYAIVVK